MNEREFTQLKQEIRRLTGIDLEQYKAQQMHRRLGSLISTQASSVQEYCQLIQDDKDALTKLKKFLTINVSEFFRDLEQFDLLRNQVLPQLIKQRAGLSVWSAGCSHGGEPYTMAILLEELAPGQKHRVLATDIDDAVLEKAKNGGPYTEADVSNVERRFILKYFTKSENSFHVIDKLRSKVQFKRQNILSDTFERGFDLILCRNVVIYFSDEAKERLYKGFYNSLKDDGVLFIGATETLLSAKDLGFDRLHNCFYRKNAGRVKAASRRKVGSI